MKFKSRYLQHVKTSEGGEREADERNGFNESKTQPPTDSGAAGLAYRYPEAFTVDLENGCVRFGFRCLIPGSEGAGTQFLYFDTAGRVSSWAYLNYKNFYMQPRWPLCPGYPHALSGRLPLMLSCPDQKSHPACNPKKAF